MGACLVRVVAENKENISEENGVVSNKIIGHMAIGTIPFNTPQYRIFSEYFGHSQFMEIRRGIVHPDWIGQGVGGKLSKFATKWVMERNYVPVAATLEDRKNSKGMLSRYQWQKVATVPYEFENVKHNIALWVPPQKLLDKSFGNR